MLALMMAPYALFRVLSHFRHRDYDLQGAAAIGLTLLFMFTGMGHFVQTEPMSQMLPPWVPMRVPIILVTGAMEFALAAGFIIRKFRRFTGLVAAAALVLMFPANVYAALNRIPMGAHAWGPVYLLIRAPLQIAILLWIYWFTIKRPINTMNQF
jgi:uncharacterized membrane protein